MSVGNLDNVCALSMSWGDPILDARWEKYREWWGRSIALLRKLDLERRARDVPNRLYGAVVNQEGDAV